MADVREGAVLIRLVFLMACVALIFASIAMALPFWSEKGDVQYGLWSMCIRGIWNTYTVRLCTSMAQQGDCQGLLNAARAFAVVGMVFIVLTMLIALAMIRHRKVTGLRLTFAAWILCIAACLASLFTVLCWVLWLAFVESTCNGSPKISNYGPPWILQVVSSAVMLLSSLFSCAGGYMIAVSPRALMKLREQGTAGTLAEPGMPHTWEEDPWIDQGRHPVEAPAALPPAYAPGPPQQPRGRFKSQYRASSSTGPLPHERYPSDHPPLSSPVPPQQSQHFLPAEQMDYPPHYAMDDHNQFYLDPSLGQQGGLPAYQEDHWSQAHEF